ncbi:MAG TPA: hypothetical protein VKO61_00535 [Candidatus Paceibacterota bacterium]|nr:hypothetical protein [Candidatus Paceibacterota bacterium]
MIGREVIKNLKEKDDLYLFCLCRRIQNDVPLFQKKAALMVLSYRNDFDPVFLRDCFKSERDPHIHHFIAQLIDNPEERDRIKSLVNSI